MISQLGAVDSRGMAEQVDGTAAPCCWSVAPPCCVSASGSLCGNEESDGLVTTLQAVQTSVKTCWHPVAKGADHTLVDDSIEQPLEGAATDVQVVTAKLSATPDPVAGVEAECGTLKDGHRSGASIERVISAVRCGCNGSSGTHQTTHREHVQPSHEFGVPEHMAHDLLRGPTRTAIAVWHYWRSKRLKDSDGKPLMPRLRQEAEGMARRKEQMSRAYHELMQLRAQLLHMHRLLVLVKRREMLKRHIVTLDQACMEGAFYRACNGNVDPSPERVRGAEHVSKVFSLRS